MWRCSSHNCLLSTPARPPAAGHDDKLLSVCAEFAAYIQNLTDCAEDFIEEIKRFENDNIEKFINWDPHLPTVNIAKLFFLPRGNL